MYSNAFRRPGGSLVHRNKSLIKTQSSIVGAVKKLDNLPQSPLK